MLAIVTSIPRSTKISWNWTLLLLAVALLKCPLWSCIKLAGTLLCETVVNRTTGGESQFFASRAAGHGIACRILSQNQQIANEIHGKLKKKVGKMIAAAAAFDTFNGPIRSYEYLMEHLPALMECLKVYSLFNNYFIFKKYLKIRNLKIRNLWILNFQIWKTRTLLTNGVLVRR